MRVQFKGAYSFDELRDAFDSLITNLLENNIDSLMNLNVYFTPTKSGASIILADTTGQEIDWSAP